MNTEGDIFFFFRNSDTQEVDFILLYIFHSELYIRDYTVECIYDIIYSFFVIFIYYENVVNVTDLTKYMVF
jgi:hypothetical protein